METIERKKILLVDDETDIAESLKFLLLEEGYDVETVSSGKNALNALKDGGYYGLILDWIMPGMTGREVLDELKKSKIKLPTLVMSAAPPSAVEPHLEEGVSFLRKPFDIEDFLKVIVTVF